MGAKLCSVYTHSGLSFQILFVNQHQENIK